MFFRNALGHILRTERLRQKKTMRDLSTLAHISIGFISEVERGEKEIASELVERWALTLGLQPYEVYLETAYLMAGERIDVPDTVEELLTLT